MCIVFFFFFAEHGIPRVRSSEVLVPYICFHGAEMCVFCARCLHQYRILLGTRLGGRPLLDPRRFVATIKDQIGNLSGRFDSEE
jgi:hypothetical protein